MALTLHGGGQGFESPRLHSRNVAVVIITKRKFLASLESRSGSQFLAFEPQRELLDGVDFERVFL